MGVGVLQHPHPRRPPNHQTQQPLLERLQAAQV